MCRSWRNRAKHLCRWPGIQRSQATPTNGRLVSVCSANVGVIIGCSYCTCFHNDLGHLATDVTLSQLQAYIVSPTIFQPQESLNPEAKAMGSAGQGILHGYMSSRVKRWKQDDEQDDGKQDVMICHVHFLAEKPKELYN